MSGDLAFRFTVPAIDDSAGIVAAPTRSKARYAIWSSANEVGYSRRLGDIRILCRRAPEHDGWAATARTGQCVCEEYVTPARGGGMED